MPDSVFLEILKLDQYEQDLDATKKVEMEDKEKQVLNAKRKEVDKRAFMITAQKYLERVNKNKTT